MCNHIHAVISVPQAEQTGNCDDPLAAAGVREVFKRLSGSSDFLQIGDETHFQSGRFVSEVLRGVSAHRRNRHLLVAAQAKEQTKQKQNPPLDLKPLPAERHFCVKETTLKTPHGATWSTC